MSEFSNVLSKIILQITNQKQEKVNVKYYTITIKNIA